MARAIAHCVRLTARGAPRNRSGVPYTSSEPRHTFMQMPMPATMREGVMMPSACRCFLSTSYVRAGGSPTIRMRR